MTEIEIKELLENKIYVLYWINQNKALVKKIILNKTFAQLEYNEKVKYKSVKEVWLYEIKTNGFELISNYKKGFNV